MSDSKDRLVPTDKKRAEKFLGKRDEQDGLKGYNPLPTLLKFHQSESFFRCIRGPIGSGKSVGCVMEMFLRAMRQEPHNGKRRSRWAVIRNTHAQLVATSIATFRERFPEVVNGEVFCPITQEDRGYLKARLQRPLDDGTSVDMEVLFIALDRSVDFNKIKSLDLTGAWLNELSEINENVLRMTAGRVGRFPPEDTGGPTWNGIIADTNPPDEDHWLAKLEYESPEIVYEGKVYKYDFFVQPPALLPATKNGIRVYVPNRGQGNFPPAENIENLADGYGYYIKQIPGATEGWIKVFILGQLGSIVSGKAVYHEYSDELHRSKEIIRPMRGRDVYIGLDWGYAHSAAIFCQLLPDGRLAVIDELIRQKSGIKGFIAENIRPLLNDKYSECVARAIGDPAGVGHSSVDGISPIQAANDAGLQTEPARTNDPFMRQEAVRGFLNKLVDGKPGLVISPNCKHLLRGFRGEYKFKKSGSAEIVDKNEYSHIQDALQYVCVNIVASGATERNTLGGKPRYEIKPADYIW